MRSTRTRTSLETAVLGVALSACTGGVKPPIGQARDGPPQRGGTLHTAFYTNVRSLDAATGFDTAASAIEELIYEKLVNYDEHGKLVPELAERIDVAPDGKRYVFTLHRGVRFQDGSELTAADVKRSVERVLHPDTPCPVPSFYERILGYEAFHGGKQKDLAGVKVEGDYVVAFELSQPDATFLHVMALPVVAPLCKSAGSTWDRSFNLHPCGAGPFKVTLYEPGSVIRMVRHEGYWKKGLPYLDAIEWSLTMQSFTQRFKFEDGAIDYMREFNDTDSLLFRSSTAWHGMGEWEASMTSAGSYMNTQMKPFDDVHLRRAVAFSVDRDQVAAVRPGHVLPHTRAVPRAIVPITPDLPGQRYDHAQALEEMRLAGYAFDPATGKGGYPEEIPYLANIDSFAQQAAEVYQQQLARIGIKIRIQLVGWPTFLARSSQPKTSPMGFVGWHADFADASDFFEPILSTTSIGKDESQNYAFFSNAEMDALLTRARRSTDSDERARLYRRAEAIVAELAPWANVYEYRYFELWQPYVHGYRPHPILSQAVRGMWFDRAEQKLATGDQTPRWRYATLSGRRSSRPRPKAEGALALVFGAR